MRKRTVAVLGTFDTKGIEYHFLIQALGKAGVDTISIDAGIFEPYFTPDISHEQVAQAAGTIIDQLVKSGDRGNAVEKMTIGAPKIIENLYQEGKIHGIISLGGSAGTTIGTSAMRALPIGFPKIMVSTVGSGDTRPYVKEKDIMMMNSVVDIAGVNSISATIITNAANAIAGMVMGSTPEKAISKPLIAATMFGVTTPCVTIAKEYLEKAGYEVLVFHATGSGGKAMEALIEAGMINGVLDITTTEWCDELVGGVFAAGQERLDAAAKMGIPQIVSVGALDMVNFGPPDTIPESFKHRKFYQHNPTVTLMRTTVEENKKLGEIIGGKLSKSKAPCVLFLPLSGVSMIDDEGKPFWGPEEDKALFQSLKTTCDKNAVKIVERNLHINDEEFALEMAMELVNIMNIL